jgi:hypothetical protein
MAMKRGNSQISLVGRRMRYLIAVLLAVLCLSPAHAVEQPKNQQNGPAYPRLTLTGMEDFELGQRIPNQSSFPGLTYKTYQEEDWDESGRSVMRTQLKFYHFGYYLGRGLLDGQGRLVELEITDWRASFEGKFGPASQWKHVQSQLPEVNLHYAYMLDSLVAESPELPGLQVHFPTESYRVQSKLKGDFTPLTLAELPGQSKAIRLRLFWVHQE